MLCGVIKDITGDEINEKGNYLRRGTAPGFSDNIPKSVKIPVK